MSARYRCQSPTTTVVTSTGEQYNIKGPVMSSDQYLSRRRRSSIEEDTQKILKQIRVQKAHISPSRHSNASGYMSPSAQKSSLGSSPTNYRSPITSTYAARISAGLTGNSIASPPRPTQRLSSLPPLPPALPKIIKHHYPLPPPSFPEAMISVSKRLRNRSVSPSPQYAALQVCFV